VRATGSPEREDDLKGQACLDCKRNVFCPLSFTGKRACPPEDCGGIWGYAGFLEAIRDPQHPEHEAMVEWIGGAFDPEAFDLDEVNRELQRLK
jgi:Plasmid pRiA4b ORF-3-like protein